MIRADKPFTEDMMSLILAYLAEVARDESFIAAISRVSAALIADEIREQSGLLSLEYTIDPVAIAQEWIVSTGPRVVGVNDITEARIKEILVRALEDGDTVIQVARKINEKFGDMGNGRAKLIARTEVLGATNFASFRTYMIANVPFKRWIATMDDRVRDSHAEANGQLRGVSEPFDINGYAMMYPGDPDGPASEVCNCRCMLVPETNSRSTIWTAGRARAIWRAYVMRAVAWDAQMLTAVQHEFETQRLGIVQILHRQVS